MKNNRYSNVILISILILAMFSLPINKVCAYSTSYKIIKTIQIDTTGDKIKERIEILADEEKKGYIAKVVQDNNRTYLLKPAKEFDFLAPYTSFYDLNIIVADVNKDSIPEIITWGDMTHENEIHIFRWNGTDYKIVFSGFYQGFSFKDITGDDVLEFIIENRLYGTGDENIYYQWQRGRYNKIYYEIHANRGFDVINGLLAILPVEQSYMYSKEVLDNHFTNEWIGKKDNLEVLKKFKKGLFQIQITEYLNNKIGWVNGTADMETWTFKVKTYRLVDTVIFPKELTMIVDMKFVDNTVYDGWDKWRIQSIKFIE